MIFSPKHWHLAIDTSLTSTLMIKLTVFLCARNHWNWFHKPETVSLVQWLCCFVVAGDSSTVKGLKPTSFCETETYPNRRILTEMAFMPRPGSGGSIERVRAGALRCVFCVSKPPTETPSLCRVGGSLPNQGSLHEVSAGVSRDRRGDQSSD